MLWQTIFFPDLHSKSDYFIKAIVTANVITIPLMVKTSSQLGNSSLIPETLGLHGISFLLNKEPK